jgi:aryl-alcohol dehydrogenase-like predicted oxidoreductase
MKACEVARERGIAGYQTIQNNFSINHRRFEDALAEICRREGLSLLPYSPIGGGVLSGKYNDGARPEGARFSDYLSSGGVRQKQMAERFVNPKSLATTAELMDLAAEIGLDVVTLAVAWSKQHDFVASTIIGANSIAQLEPSLAAAGVVLEPATLERIDAITQKYPYPMG